MIANNVLANTKEQHELYREFCLLTLDKLLGKQIPTTQQDKIYKKITEFNNNHQEDISNSNNSALNQWLSIHGFNLSAISHINKIISTKTAIEPSHESTSALPSISLDTALDICKHALSYALPKHANIINDIITNAPRCTSTSTAKHRYPFTQDLGWHQLPFISLHWHNTPADLLSLAHELSHAVQLVASQHNNSFDNYDMAPVFRETCAFIGELSVLHWLTINNHPYSDIITQAWQADNNIYYGYCTVLAKFINNSNSIFNYQANYPIARYLANIIFAKNTIGNTYTYFTQGDNNSLFLQKLTTNTIN